MFKVVYRRSSLALSASLPSPASTGNRCFVQSQLSLPLDVPPQWTVITWQRNVVGGGGRGRAGEWWNGGVGRSEKS